MKFKQEAGGVIRRREKRVVGLFIDGTGLDRATRRLKRKVDLTLLVRGVTSGLKPIVARYYTLIPYEDDSRQRAFLEAVAKAGLTVIVKRLPPKGVSRQVSVDPEMAADITAFSLGHSKFSSLSEFILEPTSSGSALPTAEPFLRGGNRPPLLGNGFARNASRSEPTNDRPSLLRPAPALQHEAEVDDEEGDSPRVAPVEKRLVTVVCPSRDLTYAMSLAGELGAETATADFGQFNTGDLLKSAARWIDLSDSETIWRE